MDAFHLDSPDNLVRFDRQSGQLVVVERSMVSAFEEGESLSPDDFPAWQKQMIEQAKAIAEDSGERFIRAPEKFDFHEYRYMEKFIGTLNDESDADQLWRAIKGKGAFRHFKNTADSLGLLQEWFRYRDDALKEFVIRWAVTKNIALEDDTRHRE
jgi:hypothetical protein